MNDSRPDLAALFRQRLLPNGSQIVFASEKVETFSLPAFLEKLDSLRFAGGQDNFPALSHAWDLAAPTGAKILWIHGPQPVLLGPGTEILQKIERRPNAVEILDLALHPSPNVLLKEFGPRAKIRPIPFGGNLNQRLLQLQNQIVERSFRTRSLPPEQGVVGDSHLARLWAAAEIERTKNLDRPAALQLAGRYQLVTSISGAVVLETVEQFKAAGLTAVDSNTVPAVPEPSTWALLGLGTVLLWLVRRRLNPSSVPSAPNQA